MGPSILVDDSALVIDFNYLGTQWARQIKDNSVLNGTLTVCNPATQSTDIVPTKPQLTIFFWGSGINLYGNVTNNLAANYTIDQTTLRPVPFPIGISNGKTGVNLFSILNLTEGLSHTLNIFPTAGIFALDYVTYVPNIDTPLTAAQLILDDADPALQYGNGQWNHTTGDFQQGRPYNGTMTGTNTKGATMSLTFEGSSITVYGLLNRVDGRLSASFVVDSQNSSGSAFTPFDGEQEDTDSSRWMLSQQFFHQDLTPGQHSLQMTLEDISGPQMLWIDSVVFEGTSSTKLSFPSSGSGSGGSLLPPTSSSGLSKAAIGGIAAAAFFLAICCLSYAKRKWRGTSSKPIGSNNTHNNNYVPPPPPPPAPAPAMYNSANSNPYVPYAPVPNANQYDYNRPSPPAQQPYEYRDWSTPPIPVSVPVPPPKATRSTTMPAGDLAGSDRASSSYPSPRPPTTGDGSASATSTPHLDQRADSYYTYSSKADLIGLEWGVRPDTGSSVNVGDGASAVKMPMPVPVTLPTAPAEKAQYRAVGDGARGVGETEPHAHGDGAATAAVASDVQADGRGPSPSNLNHVHEDGRDPDEEEAAAVEPQGERDAGPVGNPPAYDDTLYTR